MNYSRINYFDIANGTGIRVSLYVSGCRNHCDGCFNPETWDFNYGQLYTMDKEKDIFDHITDYHSGLTILGGEPFEKENIDDIFYLIYRFKTTFKDKDIWIYSGYNYEYLVEKYSDILRMVDILVDGKFDISKKDFRLKFKGSFNQRIICASLSSKDNIILSELN